MEPCDQEGGSDHNDAAMADREALAAVTVFGREEHAPAAVPVIHNGNKAIVAFDRDELDDRKLARSFMPTTPVTTAAAEEKSPASP